MICSSRSLIYTQILSTSDSCLLFLLLPIRKKTEQRLNPLSSRGQRAEDAVVFREGNEQQQLNVVQILATSALFLSTYQIYINVFQQTLFTWRVIQLTAHVLHSFNLAADKLWHFSFWCGCYRRFIWTCVQNRTVQSRQWPKLTQNNVRGKAGSQAKK